MQHINIIGSAGAGKSTLGRALAARLDAPLVELDQLYWQPNWQHASDDEFRKGVAAVLAGERWVVCGNYRAVRELVWGRADTVVWLDYPLAVSFPRLWRRTWQRIISQEELWGGNRESWRTQFLSRDSLLLYALRTHRRRRHELAAQLSDPGYAHLSVLRLRRPHQTTCWLAGMQDR